MTAEAQDGGAALWSSSAGWGGGGGVRHILNPEEWWVLEKERHKKEPVGNPLTWSDLCSNSAILERPPKITSSKMTLLPLPDCSSEHLSPDSGVCLSHLLG